MDSFFLSKSIEGEARGERGWDTASGFGRAPRFACPLCAYTGDVAPLPCLRCLPFARRPCAQARGRGGARLPGLRASRLRVALRAKRREGGAASGFAPRLSAWRTNGEGPAPLPHTPCSRAASAQKPRWGVTSRN